MGIPNRQWTKQIVTIRKVDTNARSGEIHEGGRQAGRQVGRQANGQTSRHASRDVIRQASRQAGRQVRTQLTPRTRNMRWLRNRCVLQGCLAGRQTHAGQARVVPSPMFLPAPATAPVLGGSRRCVSRLCVPRRAYPRRGVRRLGVSNVRVSRLRAILGV